MLYMYVVGELDDEVAWCKHQTKEESNSNCIFFYINALWPIYQVYRIIISSPHKLFYKIGSQSYLFIMLFGQFEFGKDIVRSHDIALQIAI